jgi:hypothetical protein
MTCHLPPNCWTALKNCDFVYFNSVKKILLGKVSNDSFDHHVKEAENPALKRTSAQRMAE